MSKVTHIKEAAKAIAGPKPPEAVAAAPGPNPRPKSGNVPTASGPAKAASTSIREVPEEVDSLLVGILRVPRRHDSACERSFTKWLNGTLAENKHGKLVPLALDSFGFEVPLADGKNSRTMFSCHVDTVDWVGECNDLEKVKTLTYDPNFGIIGLDSKSVGSCLGADDGVGIWIMLKMIEAKVPGFYVFHRGEECGGLSAKDNVRLHGDKFKVYDRCIAFDRPNNTEVITHQGGTRCASNKFATALAAAWALVDDELAFKPSDRGVYTDSKEYRGLIAECVNIGVGYTSQHGKTEDLDYGHAMALMQACCKINWETLPTERKPKIEVPPPSRTGNYYTGGAYTGGYGRSAQRSFDEDDEWSYGHNSKNGAKPGKKPARQPSALETVAGYTYDDLIGLFADDPDEGALMVIRLARELAKAQADVDVLEGIFNAR